MNALKQIVLISGANQGIGFEIVKKLASDDSSYHILMGTRSLSNGQAALASLPPGLSVQPLELDIMSDASISRAHDSVAHEFGRLDVLINNAGIAIFEPPPTMSLREQYSKTFETNSVSAACLTEAFLPLLRRSTNPRIIFMTSGLGSIGSTLDPSSGAYGMDMPTYKASKAAMNMIMAHYAVKLKEDGFKVNACCPGHVATGLNGGTGNHPSVGAINACRLATAGPDGETGTYTNKDKTFPW